MSRDGDISAAMQLKNSEGDSAGADASAEFLTKRRTLGKKKQKGGKFNADQTQR